jgi:NAD(P)-dependent dehydrogenase (short-subunit alcohol dehydrogenase family)
LELHLGGKTVIVTGGSGVIGRVLVLAFAAEGANVISASRNEEVGRAVVAFSEKQGDPGRILPVKTDVTDRESVAAMVRAAQKNFGAVDILVNNAGGVAQPGEFSSLSEQSRAWERALNIDGVINCIQAVTGDVQARHGAIVNVSSSAAFKGMVGYVHYGATKSFLDGLTRGLAAEWGRHGARVNSVVPGWTVPEEGAEFSEGSFWHRLGPNVIGTPDDWRKSMAAGTMPGAQDIAMGRLGSPTDIANAVLFLASDAASYITGQSLQISGGMLV